MYREINFFKWYRFLNNARGVGAIAFFGLGLSATTLVLLNEKDEALQAYLGLRESGIARMTLGVTEAAYGLIASGSSFYLICSVGCRKSKTLYFAIVRLLTGLLSITNAFVIFYNLMSKLKGLGGASSLSEFRLHYNSSNYSLLNSGATLEEVIDLVLSQVLPLFILSFVISIILSEFEKDVEGLSQASLSAQAAARGLIAVTVAGEDDKFFLAAHHQIKGNGSSYTPSSVLELRLSMALHLWKNRAAYLSHSYFSDVGGNESSFRAFIVNNVLHDNVSERTIEMLALSNMFLARVFLIQASGNTPIHYLPGNAHTTLLDLFLGHELHGEYTSLRGRYKDNKPQLSGFRLNPPHPSNKNWSTPYPEGGVSILSLNINNARLKTLLELTPHQVIIDKHNHLVVEWGFFNNFTEYARYILMLKAEIERERYQEEIASIPSASAAERICDLKNELVEYINAFNQAIRQLSPEKITALSFSIALGIVAPSQAAAASQAVPAIQAMFAQGGRAEAEEDGVRATATAETPGYPQGPGFHHTPTPERRAGEGATAAPQVMVTAV